MQVSYQGRCMLGQEEAIVLTSYSDGKHMSIGAGHNDPALKPGTVITLANGQVWQITDDTSAAYELDNPRVTVRRAALGSFMLDIEGARRTPRARRLR